MGLIYKGVAKYVDAVSWDNWSYADSVPWENYISGDIDFAAARGDGDQVLAMVHGLNTNPTINISNLDDGDYDIQLFDFITGDVVDVYSNQPVVGGSLSMTLDLTNANLDVTSDGHDRKRTGILYIEGLVTDSFQTCQDLGYKCCNSCVPGTEHPENDTDCPGQSCCGECDTSGQALSFRTTGDVAIDGDPSEWADLLGHELPYTNWVSVSAEPPESGQDCSAVFKSMWDDDNIYVLVEVTDNMIYHDSDTPWHDDSVEFYLDGGHEKAGSYDDDDFQLTVDTNNDFGGVRSDQLEFNHSVTSTADSYTIEYAVPLSALQATPTGGVVMGFDIGVNDDDDGGNTRETQLVWHGNGTGWRDPSQFGEIVFKIAHRADTSPRDGCMEEHELIPFIDLWKYNSTAYPMREMMEAVVLYYNPESWCS